MQKIEFIINPKSGKGKSIQYPEKIAKFLNRNLYEYNIAFTEYPGHAEILAKESIADIVVAVGGDGTVNEVARGLVGSTKVLGILPCGSGNGLAFHHRIPASPPKAIEILNKGHIIRLDYCRMNSHAFFCTCGVGLDAEVSKKFATDFSRGFFSYIVDSVKLLFRYVPLNYCLSIDGKEQCVDATLITVGNANQWGNNAYITPDAKSDDGELDVTVIRRMNVFQMALLAVRLFSGSILKSSCVDAYRGRTVEIKRIEGGAAHFDGEYCEENNNISIIVDGAIYILSR